MDNEIKRKVLNAIKDHVDVFIPKSSIQYVIRCPLCGDTDKDPTHAHCYIKCSNDPLEPLQYNCFLCNNNGRIGRYFLDKLGIEQDLIKEYGTDIRYNKLSTMKDIKELNLSDIDMNSDQIRYIEYRLGKGLTKEDYMKFRIVPDIHELEPYISDKRIKHTLPSNMNSVSFLTEDNSLLLTRLFEDDGNRRWMKKRLFHSDNKSMYTIKTLLNLFTEEEITINISEGVLDVISIYKNFNEGLNVHIAVIGSNYIEGLEYMMSKGLIGENIKVKFYIDDNINAKQLKNQLKIYKWIFKSIHIYENILYKDIGTKIDKIQLKEYKV